MVRDRTRLGWTLRTTGRSGARRKTNERRSHPWWKSSSKSGRRRRRSRTSSKPCATFPCVHAP
eukprot:1086078-Prorocentrum_minimum.AAC.1